MFDALGMTIFWPLGEILEKSRARDGQIKYN
jgi:hypothetical protein